MGSPYKHVLIPLIMDTIEKFLKYSDRILINQLPYEGPLREALGGKKE
ncbi:hypothetical protein [Pasteuria penetrans]|nr:hypothetical protein [Pasteuria penetrans]